MNKKEAIKQFESMEEFNSVRINGRTIKQYSEAQVRILIDVIFLEGDKHEKKI